MTFYIQVGYATTEYIREVWELQRMPYNLNILTYWKYLYHYTCTVLIFTVTKRPWKFGHIKGVAVLTEWGEILHVCHYVKHCIDDHDKKHVVQCMERNVSHTNMYT